MFCCKNHQVFLEVVSVFAWLPPVPLHPPSPPDGQITVMCGSNYIAIRAVQDFFQYFNVPLEALHLPNQTCRAEIEVIDNVTYYMSSVSKEKYLACGGKPLEVLLQYNCIGFVRLPYCKKVTGSMPGCNWWTKSFSVLQNWVNYSLLNQEA